MLPIGDNYFRDSCSSDKYSADKCSRDILSHDNLSGECQDRCLVLHVYDICSWTTLLLHGKMLMLSITPNLTQTLILFLILTLYTLNPKPNHHPHSNSLLLEVSSQEQYCRQSKCHITFVLFLPFIIMCFFSLFSRYLIENITKDQCTVSYKRKN